MHDALSATAYSYEDDPSISDISDEEQAMHVMAGIAWHRRKPNLSKTACGMAYHSEFSPLRRDELRHPLCRLCFCEDELNDADELAENERKGTTDVDHR